MSRNFTWNRIAFFICAAAWLATGSTARIVADEANAKGEGIPDAAALMHSVEDNQKHLESIQRDYIFHRKEEDQNVDSHGNVKSTDTREYEVHYVAGWEIDRLISKNGKPVSSREGRVQDEEVRRQESHALKQEAKRDSGEEPGKNDFTVSKFLAANRFTNLRKEIYQQHEVYAMDFEPRTDFEPHSILDKVLKALGGTIWIDENAHQVVRLEARFLSSIKVGGGFVGSLEKGGNVVLEQRFLNGEVWMPSYSEVHINERVFFIPRPINEISTYSDYRKFHATSHIAGVKVATPPAA
jgi:hypothetical protein